MPYRVNTCPLCGHATTGVETRARLFSLHCVGCGGDVTIEFDPPDDPTLRARITRIDPPLDRREIVLVDDDPGFLETFGAVLRYDGYAVVAAATMFTAVRHLRHRVPHLLITDVRLGAENGWHLAAYVKRRHPTLPVIIITGFPTSRDHEADRWGLPVFLKPFEPDDLLAYVRATVWPA